MSKLGRKIRRSQVKRKKKEAQKDMNQKVALFQNIGEGCLVCDEPFDKTDKDMVKSWYVIVRKEQNKVNLYCPKCWTKAIDLVNKLKEEINAEQS